MGMKLKIDNAGRIVLPKPVRDRLGLRAGSDLDLAESAEGILLTPVRQEASLIRRNGLLVHRGKLPKGQVWDQLIEQDREDRLNKLAGL
jgi:AbrB family looped-hinge helix DNA binding protein